jgi:hypothetical protein
MSIRRLSRRSLILATPALLLPSRLSALSTGQLCRPVAGPAYEAGFVNLVFFDDFLTHWTVDINGTGRVGYNWYTKQLSGSAIAPAPNPTPSSWLTFNNSIMTIHTSTLAIGGLELCTIGHVGGTDYVKGFLLTPGNGTYVEVSAAFDPSLSYGVSDGRPYPGPLWMQDINGLLAQVNGTALANFAEWDIMEAIPTGVGTIAANMNNHYWSSITVNNTVTNVAAITPGTGFNTYGMLWKTMAGNGGTTGLVQRFFNGVHLPLDMTYTATTGSTPAASPSNPYGVFSSADSAKFPLLMVTGINWPMQVDYVAVWQ